MGDTGSELTHFPAGNTGVAPAGGSNSGNKDTPFGDSAGVAKPTDPDLSTVVAAWPALPPALRAGIVAMVRAAR